MTDDLTNATWFTSSYSNSNSNCVEVAFLGGGRVAVRDTKDHGTGPVLVFTPAEWTAFVQGTRDGEFTPRPS
jgi:hypothetical protein